MQCRRVTFVVLVISDNWAEEASCHPSRWTGLGFGELAFMYYD